MTVKEYFLRWTFIKINALVVCLMYWRYHAVTLWPQWEEKLLNMYTLRGDSLSVERWRNLWEAKLLPPPRERDSDVPTSCNKMDTNAPKTRRWSGRSRTLRLASNGDHPVSDICC